MNAPTMPAQLDFADLIDRVVASAELQADLIHRRDLPLAAIGGCERLLFQLVTKGLPENALRGAAALVVALEQQALDQKGNP